MPLDVDRGPGAVTHIGRSLALVGLPVPFVREPFPFVREPVAFVRNLLALAWRLLHFRQSKNRGDDLGHDLANRSRA